MSKKTEETKKIKDAKRLFQPMVVYFKSQLECDNHRYLSWEHCFKIFQKVHTEYEKSDSRKKNAVLNENIDNLALNLGFYLASWGMYRGSSFLLQKDYKIHKKPIEVLFDEEYEKLWNEYDPELAFGLMKDLAKAYKVKSSFTDVNDDVDEETNGTLTDTLFTKILLGVYGNIPAYDRYCKLALSKLEYKNKLFNKDNKTSDSFDNIKNLAKELKIKELKIGKDDEDDKKDIYTEMKKMDMFLFECGNMLENADNLVKSQISNISFAKKIKAIIDFYEFISTLKDEHLCQQVIKTVFERCNTKGSNYFKQKGQFFKEKVIHNQLTEIIAEIKEKINKHPKFKEKYGKLLNKSETKDFTCYEARLITDIYTHIKDNRKDEILNKCPLLSIRKTL